jgi:hypothetical protein
MHMNNDLFNVFIAVAIVAAFVIAIVVIVLQERRTGKLTNALIELAKNAQSNTRALDLVESVGANLVPKGLVEFILKGGAWAKTVLPDQWDQVVDVFMNLFNTVTDGQPNTPPSREAVAAALQKAMTTNTALADSWKPLVGYPTTYGQLTIYGKPNSAETRIELTPAAGVDTQEIVRLIQSSGSRSARAPEQKPTTLHG